MMSERLPAMLLLALASLLTAGCGSHAGADARTPAAQQSARSGQDSAAMPNADARIEAVPGLQLADSLAESKHAAALVRCDRLSAAAREACRDQADAEYQSVLTRAMQLGADADPQVTK